MVFYALTVAMIAITVWETYDAAAKIVSEEATALATLYRDVSSYPPSTQTRTAGRATGVHGVRDPGGLARAAQRAHPS